MRVLLIFSFGYLLQLQSYSQISKLPYQQDFEKPFLEFGNNIMFIENWTGNEVKATTSRIFRLGKFPRNGKFALAVQPISSFDGNIIIDLDLSEHDQVRLHFYARSIKNGSGTRPLLVRISTSTDGGETFIKRENIGDETSFPNQDTDYSLYIYDLPELAARQKEVKIKLEIMYTAAFGTGSAARFLMDDFFIYEKEKDLILKEVIQIDSETLQLVFNQEVDKETGENKNNYHLTPSNSIILAERDERSKNIIYLKLSKEPESGAHQIGLKGILDIEQEIFLESQQFSFVYSPPPIIPGFNELLITEIMADPEPSVGLPLSEYIELYNPTNKILKLKDISFSDASSSTKLPDVLMLPGDYLLVVPQTKIALFEGIFPLIGVTSWPSLNVGGDLLSLTSADGDIIFSVNYDKSWYNDPIRNEGGWSLEMIDIGNPCGGKENWAASIDRSGGTPAKQNSIQAHQPDTSPPKLIETIAIQVNQLLLKFNEKVLLDVDDVSSFEISPYTKISSAKIQVPRLNAIILTLEEELQRNTIYQIKVDNIKDCSGNVIDNNHINIFGLPEPADSLDIIVNEVLFNARTGGVKFVELYNNSNKFINLKNWKLGNNLTVNNSSLKSITNEDLVLKPQAYMAISQNSEKLKSEYPRGKQENFFEISSLPSYTISEGTVVIHNENGDILDYFSYSDDYHSSLLKSTKGVSLERISFNGMSNHPSNWQSAASTIGFATPGYKNSQSRSNQINNKKFTVYPKVFVPENTGIADFTSFTYNLGSAGFYGNLNILDSKGNLIKKIAKNEQLPSEGFFTWDGTDDNNSKVRIGYYLVYFEIYNLSGITEILKETVVVGKSF